MTKAKAATDVQLC